MLLLNEGTLEIQDPAKGTLTFPVLPLALYDVRADYGDGSREGVSDRDVVISLHLKGPVRGQLPRVVSIQSCSYRLPTGVPASRGTLAIFEAILAAKLHS